MKMIFWHGCGFRAIKNCSMKKNIVVLPLCVFFALCSSTKKATTPVTPGISNVNVSRNDTMTSVANASSSLTPADRDWSYTANHDTSLNGTWVLESGADGNWSSTQGSSADSSTSVTTTAPTDTAMVVSDTASNATGGP